MQYKFSNIVERILAVNWQQIVPPAMTRCLDNFTALAGTVWEIWFFSVVWFFKTPPLPPPRRSGREGDQQVSGPSTSVPNCIGLRRRGTSLWV